MSKKRSRPLPTHQCHDLVGCEERVNGLEGAGGARVGATHAHQAVAQAVWTYSEIGMAPQTEVVK